MNKRLPHPLSPQMFCSPWPQSRAPAQWRRPKTRGQQHSSLLPEDLRSRSAPNTAAPQRGARPSPTSLQHSQKPQGSRRGPGKDSKNPGIMGPSGLIQATRLVSKGKISEWSPFFYLQILPSLTPLKSIFAEPWMGLPVCSQGLSRDLQELDKLGRNEKPLPGGRSAGWEWGTG